VVLGQLRELVVVQVVGAAVADVHDVGIASLEDDGGERRRGMAQPCVHLGLRVQPAIQRAQRARGIAGNARRGGCGEVPVDEAAHRELGRHAPGGARTDAVRKRRDLPQW
jgi:hypothetical protein